MKKITIFLLIMMMWHSAQAANSGSYIPPNTVPSDNTRVERREIPRIETHTIDKRKYVSRDRAPFSAVVGLRSSPNDTNWCSGTLTADGIVVTAKHCVYEEGRGYTQLETLYINHKTAGNVGIKERLSSGANIYAGGDYHETYDWALLVPKKDIKSTVHVSRAKNNVTADIVNVGYGALKILSDQEIRTIRTKYSEWLNRNAGTNAASSSGTDLDTWSTFGAWFVGEIMSGGISGVSADTFKDTHRLKASYCRATASNQQQNARGCQGWGGDSGGSVFVKQNNEWYLYGIHVSGYHEITNNRNTYAKMAHMVPVNVFIEHYNRLKNKIKKGN